MPYAVENVRAVIGKKPVFGICMGHQLLGQAFGGTTFKLKFGHHGGNHPIRFEETSKPLLIYPCTLKGMTKSLCGFRNPLSSSIASVQYDRRIHSTM